MNRNTKIQLIQKHFGQGTSQWIIESCLKILKDYDKQKKAHRIELLTKLRN